MNSVAGVPQTTEATIRRLERSPGMACPGELHVQLCQRETRQPTLRAWRLVSAFVFLLSIWSTPLSGATTSPNASSEMHRGHARSVRVPAIDVHAIRVSLVSI